MIIEQLRERTKAAHQSLEKTIVLKLKAIRSNEDYAAILDKFYGYNRALEQQIDKYMDDTKVPAYSQRRKAHLLLEDIEAMTGKTAEPAMSTIVPEINNEFDAIGAMYVLEGSTMGGKHIQAMLAKIMNLEGNTGTRFFTCYGEQTDRMWGAFVGKLDNYTTNPEEQEQIVASAERTFSDFEKWFAVPATNTVREESMATA